MVTSRHQQLLALLYQKGTISLTELKKQFQVTPMTLWRDLKTLEEQGLLIRVHGGAILPSHQIPEPSFEKRLFIADPVKQRLAQAAVQQIHPGDLISLEGGTTVAALVDLLPEERISILTNSLPIALQLRQKKPNLLTEVPGGWLSPITGNTTGPDTLRWIQKRKTNVCFISATAFDSDQGPMDPNPLEIEVKRAFSAIATQTILLLDSRKFNQRSVAVTLHLKRLHRIITDKAPPAKIRNLLKKNHVEIQVAK